MNFIRLSALILCSLIVSHLSAQVSEGIVPRSYSLPEAFFHDGVVSVPPLDAAQVAQLDRRDDKLGHMPRFARLIKTDIGLTNSGTWYDLPDGRVWRCHVQAQGARGLVPCYDAWYLPAGATLHIYTPDHTEVIGAYTSSNKASDGYYNSGLIHGDECILEYYEPQAVAGQGKLHLNELGYAYRMVPAYRASRELGDASSCEVNVLCSEGNDWQPEHHAAVRILVKLSSGLGWCTGALINNTNMDCTPYILSADHCYQDESANYTAATAAELSQWVFYFDYKAPSCGYVPPRDAQNHVIDTLTTHLLTGCVLRAASLDNGGDNGSDFLLVKTNVTPPASYNAYYAGWSIAGATQTGVGIHHPNGDVKKISTYTTTPVLSHWGNLTINTHWRVNWASTANGDGVTEPGSSGSPLFDADKHVIGTLTGGASSCSTPQQNDLYGAMAYHWASNGLTSNRQLGAWLDPISTGAQTLDGYYNPCDITSGVADVDALSSTAVYPNPSSGIFNVNNNAGMTSLSVTNVIGEVVQTLDITGRTALKVDLTGYAAGVYLFRFGSERGVQTRKVVLGTK